MIRVWGISEKEFNSWKHDVVTLAVRKYLEDFAKANEDAQRDRLSKSQMEISPHIEYEARGVVNTARELATLEFEHLVSGYSFEPPPEEESEEADEAANPEY